MERGTYSSLEKQKECNEVNTVELKRKKKKKKKNVTIKSRRLTDDLKSNKDPSLLIRSGAGIMEADDRQVTTVFTVQPSFHHRHCTRQTEYLEELPSSTNVQSHLTMVTLHDTGFVECRWWNDGWTVKTVVT